MSHNKITNTKRNTAGLSAKLYPSWCQITHRTKTEPEPQYGQGLKETAVLEGFWLQKWPQKNPDLVTSSAHQFCKTIVPFWYILHSGALISNQQTPIEGRHPVIFHNPDLRYIYYSNVLIMISPMLSCYRYLIEHQTTDTVTRQKECAPFTNTRSWSNCSSHDDDDMRKVGKTRHLWKGIYGKVIQIKMTI